MTWKPKDYFDAGRTLTWGNDIAAHEMDAMDAGEIFTLIAADGVTPHARVTRDSAGVIREEEIGVCETAACPPRGGDMTINGGILMAMASLGVAGWFITRLVLDALWRRKQDKAMEQLWAEMRQSSAAERDEERQPVTST